MKLVLANVALLFGIIGFAGYLFLIVASALGCCAGFTSILYHKIVLGILALAVLAFLICMYNNCCGRRSKESKES